jgi:hypothetical protein
MRCYTQRIDITSPCRCLYPCVMQYQSFNGIPFLSNNEPILNTRRSLLGGRPATHPRQAQAAPQHHPHMVRPRALLLDRCHLGDTVEKELTTIDKNNTTQQARTTAIDVYTLLQPTCTCKRMLEASALSRNRARISVGEAIQARCQLLIPNICRIGSQKDRPTRLAHEPHTPDAHSQTGECGQRQPDALLHDATALGHSAILY